MLAEVSVLLGHDAALLGTLLQDHSTIYQNNRFQQQCCKHVKTEMLPETVIKKGIITRTGA